MTYRRIAIKVTKRQLVAMANKVGKAGHITNIQRIGDLTYQTMKIENEDIEIKWYKNIICAFENITRNERYYVSI